MSTEKTLDNEDALEEVLQSVPATFQFSSEDIKNQLGSLDPVVLRSLLQEGKKDKAQKKDSKKVSVSGAQEPTPVKSSKKSAKKKEESLGRISQGTNVEEDENLVNSLSGRDDQLEQLSSRSNQLEDQIIELERRLDNLMTTVMMQADEIKYVNSLNVNLKATVDKLAAAHQIRVSSGAHTDMISSPATAKPIPRAMREAEFAPREDSTPIAQSTSSMFEDKD